MKTVKTEAEFLDFARGLMGNINKLYGKKTDNKLDLPYKEYWREIPIRERTFSRLYKVAKKAIKRDMLVSIEMEEEDEAIKFILVIVTVPKNVLKTAIKLELQDDNYLQKYNKDIFTLIFVATFTILAEYYDMGLQLLTVIESMEDYEMDLTMIAYSYDTLEMLVNFLIAKGQELLDEKGIKVSLIKEYLIDGNVYNNPLYIVNPEIAEILIKVVKIGYKFVQLLNKIIFKEAISRVIKDVKGK